MPSSGDPAQQTVRPKPCVSSPPRGLSPPETYTVTGAAVSILESFHDDPEKARNVRGLARMVQVSPTLTLIDLTVRGVSAGTYRATIREYGDLSSGAASSGPVWGAAAPADAGRGSLGTVEVDAEGKGSAFITHPFQVWEVIGHAMVLTRRGEAEGPLVNDADTLAGIVARSAGIWENDKTVCSCSGKTLWEEREDEKQKGML